MTMYARTNQIKVFIPISVHSMYAQLCCYLAKMFEYTALTAVRKKTSLVDINLIL